LRVQEINKLTEVTAVPLAPDYVKGVLNLRSRVITVIDVGKRLGLASRDEGRRRRNIIVLFENEFVGLLVDDIGNVFRAEIENIEQLPANVDGVQGRYIEGVLKTEKLLIGILNLAEVLG
jgi:purine-binding chemotaxis protein CheW